MEEAAVPYPITAEQLGYIDDGRHRFELIEGRLVVMEPAGTPHGAATATVTTLLGSWIRQRRLGLSVAGEPGFITARDPDTVRAPDFAFTREERLPDPLRDGYPEVLPDFAVEVVGEDRNADEDNEKAQWWVEQGVGEVWVLDPWERTATVHLPGREPRTLTEDETVEASGPLHGFRCRVGELFER